MKVINAYHSHIEIFPYIEGELLRIEKYFSVWDNKTHDYNPLGYLIDNDRLYLPRGASISMLQRSIKDAMVNIIKEHDEFDKLPIYQLNYEPRDEIQINSCDFLIGEGDFKYSRKASQLSLNLDTGDGKTYCAINSVIKLRMKSIIITHIDSIKQQWIDSFIKMTNIPEDKLINISGSDMMDKIINGDIIGEIYFVNHQTISSYCRNNDTSKLREFFKSIRCGIKIIDEAHREFKSTIRIDMFSNFKKSFYLTANFSRTDDAEKRLFDKSFASTVRFGEETQEYDSKRKHIVYIPVFYNSMASQEEVYKMKNYYGFSANSFIEYALVNDTSESMKCMLIEIYKKAKSLDGKVLILSPKKSSCEIVYDIIREEDPEANIGIINSSNSQETNEKNKSECDVISSTIKSCGTGTDIPKLRCVINLEPHNSKISINQVCGRLREFSETDDTYYFDLVDISVKRCYEMYNTRFKQLQTKCKKIVMYNDRKKV